MTDHLTETYCRCHKCRKLFEGRPIMVPVGTSDRDDYDLVMKSVGIGHCVGWCPTCVNRLKPWWRRVIEGVLRICR